MAKTIEATPEDINRHRNLTELMQLEDLVVVGREFDENREIHQIICLPRWPVALCPDCGQPSGQVHDYYRPRAVEDAPLRGQRTQLIFDARRFWCQTCQSAFTETIHDVVPNCTYTYRLMAEVTDPRRKQDVATLSAVYGLGYKLVEGMIKRAAEEKLRQQADDPVQVTCLGIDEMSLKKGHGDYCLVLSDLKGRKLLDILPDRRKESLITWLETPPPRIDLSGLEWVAIDLWQHYRDAVKTVFPDACIVADRFHVVQALQRVIHAVRRQMQGQAETKQQQATLKGLRYLLLKNEANLTASDRERLARLQKDQPKLYQLWQLRQALHDWYETDYPPDQARTELDDWLDRAAALAWKPLDKFCNTLRNWEDEVVNFFPSAHHQRVR